MNKAKVNNEKPIRILHVDDEANQLQFTKMFLEELDEEVVVDSVSDPEEAIRLQRQNSYDVVISDYKMLTMTGIELAQKVRETSNVPFILYTGQGSEEVAESAFEAGVDDYLKKEAEPSHYQVLAKRIRHTVDKYRTEQLYRKVVEESRDGIFILIDGRIVFANDATCHMYGCEGPEYFLGESLMNFILETEEQIYRYLDPHFKNSELSQLFEINFRTLNGAIRVAEVSASRITYLGQSAYLCYLRDVTQRKRMEERLEALHQQATKLATLSTVEEIASCTLDIMQTVFEYQVVSFQEVDNGYLKMIDLRGAPMVRKPLPLNGIGVTVKAARERRSVLIDDTRKCPVFFKGSVDSLSELAVPAVLRGATVAVLNVESLELKDFTDMDRKLLETLAYHVSFAFDRITVKEETFSSEDEKTLKLNYALGRLEDAEKVSSLVKGELQVSLRSIRNASGLLRDQPDLLNDIVWSIDENVDHASKVADIIRETVVASSRDIDLVEVNQIVKSVVESVYIPRSIKTKVAYQTGLLISDIEHGKMTRVLENLVHNAVEAMPDGGSLEIKITTQAETARIEVRDTGPGIPSKILTKLFTPFTTTKPGHSGLGLAFCKKTVEAIGGSIEAQTSNKGTRVTVTIPLRNA
ncbi:MAG: ATP-binding protein [Candidatus Bathyarchaeota archaeon]|nr:ATP-binding protein [Candidatus Bathyarchaeota archaeon]